MSQFLTREDILGAGAPPDISYEEIDCPEWTIDERCKLLVWGLTGEERDDLEINMLGDQDSDTRVNMKNFRAKLVARSVKDKRGVRLFSDEDIPALAAKSAVPIGRLYDVAKRLSRISKDDIDELTKNSAAAQNEDAGSN